MHIWDVRINAEKRLEDWMLTSPGLWASVLPASDECGCDLRLHPEAFDCVVAAVQLHRIDTVMPLLTSGLLWQAELGRSAQECHF